MGIPLLLIPFALVAFAWSNRIARLLAIALVFVLALAAGPILIIGNTELVHLPWGGLWSLPIARSAEPSRLIVFAYLVLALALALWLAAPTRSKLAYRRRAGASGCWRSRCSWRTCPRPTEAVNPVPLGFTPPATMQPVNQLPAFITDGLYRRYLRPGETVVIVTYRGNAGMLFQADADFYFRIAGGFINDSLTTRQDALPAAGRSAQPGDPSPDKAVQGLRPLGGDRRHHRRAGLGRAVDADRLRQAGLHGTSVGGVTIYPTGDGQHS